ncbi:sugar fermentation stimulation protein A [Candidatus Hakubella thermalkaliphila]|uniref:Sugar fermentation stimulation protein A n=1 Tax=Candidatus Hakubella thermalkaliphila TaxID=2754717 RepID=A0A6V8PS03_9ACTN|nr:hypothetical protein [Candidatus Hakubella thermalkaliphila]GFP35422.1 sugar fermentation stimulation protein A [Candidatus Hakubella thermalkaliphila]
MSQLSSDRVLGNFKDLQKAVFTGRPNRFTVECLTNNRKERAYLPNPGRLWELLLPGKELYLARDLQVSERSTKYTVVAVKKEGVPVLLHTHHANTVAKWLIEQEMISGLEGYSIVKPQVTMGRSRFDFLLIFITGPSPRTMKIVFCYTCLDHLQAEGRLFLVPRARN